MGRRGGGRGRWGLSAPRGSKGLGSPPRLEIGQSARDRHHLAPVHPPPLPVPATPKPSRSCTLCRLPDASPAMLAALTARAAGLTGALRPLGAGATALAQQGRGYATVLSQDGDTLTCEVREIGGRRSAASWG